MVQSKIQPASPSTSKTKPDQVSSGQKGTSSMSVGSRPICKDSECIGQTDPAPIGETQPSVRPPGPEKLNLFEANDFSEKSFKRLLVHDSPYFKIINFNFKAGQQLPIHSHDIEGEVCLTIVEGEGEFLGANQAVLPAKAGDVLVSAISEPHGLRAKTDLRLLVIIAPPI